MGSGTFHFKGEVPYEVQKAFDEFMKGEMKKCHRMIRKDLDEFLKPLPEAMRKQFHFEIEDID